MLIVNCCAADYEHSVVIVFLTIHTSGVADLKT